MGRLITEVDVYISFWIRSFSAIVRVVRPLVWTLQGTPNSP